MGFKQNDMFPSKYLKAEDFGENEERIVTIKDVRQEEFKDRAGKAEPKFVLDFTKDKSIVLNKTNAAILFKLLGEDTDDWFGRSIILYTMEVDSFGDIVQAIRIRNRLPQNGTARTSAQAQDSRPTAPPASNNQKQTIAAQLTRLYGPLDKEGLKTQADAAAQKAFRKSFAQLTDFEAGQLLDELERTPVAVGATGDDDEDDPFADD